MRGRQRLAAHHVRHLGWHLPQAGHREQPVLSPASRASYRQIVPRRPGWRSPDMRRPERYAARGQRPLRGGGVAPICCHRRCAVAPWPEEVHARCASPAWVWPQGLVEVMQPEDEPWQPEEYERLPCAVRATSRALNETSSERLPERARRKCQLVSTRAAVADLRVMLTKIQVPEGEISLGGDVALDGVNAIVAGRPVARISGTAATTSPCPPGGYKRERVCEPRLHLQLRETRKPAARQRGRSRSQHGGDQRVPVRCAGRYQHFAILKPKGCAASTAISRSTATSVIAGSNMRSVVFTLPASLIPPTPRYDRFEGGNGGN